MEDVHEITVSIGNATVEADAITVDKELVNPELHKRAHGITPSKTQISVELKNAQLAHGTSRGQLLDELSSTGHNECSEK